MTVSSDSNYFPVPEFGYNKMLNTNMSLGVTVYGNGGMNSDYAAVRQCGTRHLLQSVCGAGRLGVDLMQLIVAPTVAFKIAPNHSIGISPLIGYQRFKAEGLQAFGVLTKPSSQWAVLPIEAMTMPSAMGCAWVIWGKSRQRSPLVPRMPRKWTCRNSTNTKACLPNRVGLTCRRTTIWVLLSKPRPI